MEQKKSVGLRRGMVSVEPHNPEWESNAKMTIEKLYIILGGIVKDIQHIGSVVIQRIWRPKLIYLGFVRQ